METNRVSQMYKTISFILETSVFFRSTRIQFCQTAREPNLTRKIVRRTRRGGREHRRQREIRANTNIVSSFRHQGHIYLYLVPHRRACPSLDGTRHPCNTRHNTHGPEFLASCSELRDTVHLAKLPLQNQTVCCNTLKHWYGQGLVIKTDKTQRTTHFLNSKLISWGSVDMLYIIYFIFRLLP